MGNYQAYEKYKDSGVEWLGEIPEHWKSASLRWISQRYSGGTPDKAKFEYWDNGNIPWINSGAVNQQNIIEPSTYITQQGFSNSSAKWIPINALVIALAGQGKTKGMVAQTKFRVTCNQSMAAIVFDKDNSRYMFWSLTSQYKQIRGLTSDEGRDGLNLDMIGSIPCPLPTLNEQESIANFLDRKTKQIDDLIAKKEALLAKLDEKRSAIISHAVTKGLDSTVPMKDSGIEWLGDIPEHWSLSRLKFLSSVLKDGTHGSFSRVLQGYRLLSVRNINGDKFIFRDDDSRISENDFLEITKSFKVREGDIQLAIVGATLGKVAIVEKLEEDFATQRSVATIRIRQKLAEKIFIFNFFKSIFFQDYLWNNASFSAQPGVYLGTLEKCFVPLPPIKEQKIIAQFVDKKTVEINLQKAKVQEAIERLKEYRTALITNAVTGKIDVRQVSLN